MATATLSVRDQLEALIRELSDEYAVAIAPYLLDLAEAVKGEGIPSDFDRDEFRGNLGLKRLIPDPVLVPLTGVVLRGKDVPLDKRIDDGAYNWKENTITTERFPIRLDAGPCDLYMAHFGDDVEMETPEVEAWAEAHGYEVAFIEELLEVGCHSQYRELQLQFPIIALGSSAVVSGRSYVACLYRSGSRRSLYLGYSGCRWGAHCRFLLRKKPLAT